MAGDAKGLGGLGPDAEVAGDRPVGGSTQPCPLKKKTFIAVQLVGEDNSPVPGERYVIELPDGTSREGTLDDAGKAIVDGIDPGTCTIRFPDMDKDAWEPI
jgi:hypothetical protein